MIYTLNNVIGGDTVKETEETTNKELSSSTSGNNKDNSDKDFKKDFTFQRSIRKLDQFVLNELIDSADNEIKEVKYIGDEIREFKSDVKYENVIITLPNDNRPQNYITTVNMNYFEYTKTLYKVPQTEFLKVISGNRNIYYCNDYRGLVNYRLSTAYAYEFEPDYDKRQPSKFKCGDLIRTPNHYSDGKTSWYDNEYLLIENEKVFVRSFDYLLSNECKYSVDECKKIRFEITKKCEDNKYKVVQIPKDIMQIFRQITYRFEEALKYLELDQKMGYYCYNIDGTKIPVICKHQILSLQGVNPLDIAIECYKDGVCKYCRQEIVGYNVDTLTLPNSSMSAIIQFAECFKDTTVTDIVIKDIGDFIVNKLTQLGISVYSDEECNGYTYLYITKLSLESIKAFNVHTYKIKELLNKMAKQLAFLGKSDKDVEALINDNSVTDIGSVMEQLKTDLKGSTDETTGHNLLIEDVLFDSTTSREAKTTIQKLYLEDRSKIFTLHMLLKNEYNKLYNYEYSDKYKLNKTIQVIIPTIKTTIINDGFKFFLTSCDYYCPVNSIHEFKDNKCKHCGINKDMKNKEDVYKKYSEVINNMSTNPLIMNVKLEDKNKDINNILDEIKKTSEETFKQSLKLNGVEYTDIEAIGKLMEKVNIDYVKNMNEFINIDFEELIKLVKTNPEQMQKKLMFYPVNHRIISLETSVNILLSYFELYNVRDYIIIDKQYKSKQEEEIEVE